MRISLLFATLATLLISATGGAQENTALSCNDFRPTDEALQRFPNLVGACEGIVERDSKLYGKFTADVRRVRRNNVTLYLPATDQTFTISADPSQRIRIGNRNVRPRDLQRGDKIRIYLSASQFATPDIEDVLLINEADVLVDVAVQSVQVPGRVVTAAIKTVVIVEAVNKETREIKVIDASGRRHSFVADEMVENFDQIEPRDRIVTEYLESVAVFVAPPDTPAFGDASAVELAPLGEKPGVVAADTFMVRASIESVNESDRIATIIGENGIVRTVKIADDVPLELLNVGDEVRIRITEAIAISVRPADKS